MSQPDGNNLEQCPECKQFKPADDFIEVNDKYYICSDCFYEPSHQEKTGESPSGSWELENL